MSTTSVTVGTLTLFNGRTPDADGVSWVLERLDGWQGGVGVVGPATQRPQAHGTFGERGWREGRMVILEGSALCPSRAVAARVASTLAATAATGEFTTLTVADADEGTLSSTVRLGAAPTVDWSTLRQYAVRFQLPLYAPDPLRYGEVTSASTTFPARAGGLRFPLYTDGAGTDMGALFYGDLGSTGRVELVNPGTADSWPQFQVAGEVDAAGFEIVAVGTGARLVFEDPVPAGSTLVLDSATGSVLIDGYAERGGRLTYRDWAPVPAGGSSEFAFIPLGVDLGAVLTATVRPAWW